MDEDKNKRIEELKDEIKFYHEQSELQNEQFKAAIETRKLYNKSVKYAMIIWFILIVFTLMFVVSNFGKLSTIGFLDIAFDALNIAVGMFLISNSASLIFLSMFSKIKGYSKNRAIIIALMAVLVAMILIITGATHISELMDGVTIES